MTKQVKYEKNILWDASHHDFKGWYLCCYKCWHININVYPNVYFCENNFHFRENSNNPVSSLTKNKKKHSKTGILMKLTKNLVITAGSLWTKN